MRDLHLQCAHLQEAREYLVHRGIAVQPCLVPWSYRASGKRVGEMLLGFAYVKLLLLLLQLVLTLYASLRGEEAVVEKEEQGERVYVGGEHDEHVEGQRQQEWG